MSTIIVLTIVVNLCVPGCKITVLPDGFSVTSYGVTNRFRCMRRSPNGYCHRYSFAKERKL